MWTLDDALQMYRDILEPLAEEHGFSATLYGSVLTKGRGRDLDLFMVPQRDDPDREGLLQALRAHMKRVPDAVPGRWGRPFTQITTHDGWVIDLQFIPLSVESGSDERG